MSNLFAIASHSATYAKFRPSPPSAVINKIISYVKEKIPGDLEKAADVGCGTGQSTQMLQPYFQHVTGFDVSESQLNEAREGTKDVPNISYCVSPAEKLPVSDKSLQLITVSQAAHWFDLPEFFREVDRILVPNGVCALYCYLLALPEMQENSDKTKKMRDIIFEFYEGSLHSFWDKRRYFIDNLYKEVEIPDQYFTDITNIQRDETIVEKKNSTLADYLGYISTWSAFQQMKLQDPEQANKEFNHVVKSMTSIIDDKNQDLSKIPLTMETTYILLMGRKKE